MALLIEVDKNGTAMEMEHLVANASHDGHTAGIMVLACADNGFTPAVVDPIFQHCPKPIFGGVFPGLILGREMLTKGTIVARLRRPVSAVPIGDLGDLNLLQAVLEHAFTAPTLQNKTLFVFVEGLNRNISTLIETILNCYGLLPNYLGGATGSITRDIPSIICSKGLLANAAVLAAVDANSAIGVAHGYRRAAGPFRVTGAGDHTVSTLDGRPALAVYRDEIERLSGKVFADAQLVEVAREFPFGIVKMAEEMVVRVPLLLDGENLVCGGEILKGSLVHILRGSNQTLVAGAAHARQLAEAAYLQDMKGHHCGEVTAIAMDCISRAIFLQAEFHKELAALDTGYPLFGALTLGEIANTGKNYLEFYNKTAVIGLVEG